MDKFVIVGGFLCFAADVFAIASLATPEWVVVDFAGKCRGSCLTVFYKHPIRLNWGHYASL